MSETTQPSDEIEWAAVNETVRELTDDPMTPATWTELADAVDKHSDGTLAGAVIESAVGDGVLVEHEVQDSENEYSFDLSKLDGPAGEDAGGPDDIHVMHDGRRYAPSMVERDHWVIRTMPGKDIKAPWKTGTLYRAAWGTQLEGDERPDTDFETALRWSEHEATLALEGHDEEEVEGVAPSYILSQVVEDPETNIVMVDIDDCRIPETGEVHPLVRTLIDRLNSYAEISTSGKGIHVFIFGTLPEWYSGADFHADLDDEPFVGDEAPHIDVYEKIRHCVTTGRHLEGTPEDLQYRHDVLDEIVREYSVDEDTTAEDVFEQLSKTEGDPAERVKKDASGEKDISPYFEVPVSQFYSFPSPTYREVGGQIQGPHPVHGSSNGSDYADGGRNFTATRDVWYCHSRGHDSGGGALELFAVDEGYLPCKEVQAGLGNMDDIDFARLCLEFRDAGGVPSDTRPPYKALLGLAKSQGLAEQGAEMFDFGLRGLLESMWDGADSNMV